MTEDTRRLKTKIGLIEKHKDTMYGFCLLNDLIGGSTWRSCKYCANHETGKCSPQVSRVARGLK